MVKQRHVIQPRKSHLVGLTLISALILSAGSFNSNWVQATATAAETDSAKIAVTDQPALPQNNVTLASGNPTDSTNNTSVDSAGVNTSAPAATNTSAPATVNAPTSPTSGTDSAAPTTPTTAPQTKATTTDPGDTPVKFADPNLASMVAKAFNVAPAELTPNVVKNMKPFVKIFDNTNTNVTSLDGIQVLQYLPTTTTLYFQVDLAVPAQSGATYDFSPLANINFDSLALSTPNWGLLTDATLNTLMASVDTERVSMIQLSGDDAVYQANKNGLTNRQLALLGPWLVAIGNNGHAPVNEIALLDNCLTDFSPLMGITQPVSIDALGQLYYDAHKFNAVVNQPTVFTGSELIGPDGVQIHHTPNYSYNANTAHTLTAINYLGNGQYQIPQAVPFANPDQSYITFGQYGYLRDYYGAGTAFIQQTVGENKNMTFTYDGMVYRAVNWLAHPMVTVNYLNEATGDAIQSPTSLGEGANIGDPFDLTEQAVIENFTLDTAKSDSLAGTYKQDPQTINLYYTRNTVPKEEPEDPTTPTKPVVKPTTPSTKPTYSTTPMITNKVVHEKTTVVEKIKPNTTTPTTTTMARTTALPRTGESQTHADQLAVAIGALLLAALGGLTALSFARKHE